MIDNHQPSNSDSEIISEGNEEVTSQEDNRQTQEHTKQFIENTLGRKFNTLDDAQKSLKELNSRVGDQTISKLIKDNENRMNAERANSNNSTPDLVSIAQGLEELRLDRELDVVEKEYGKDVWDYISQDKLKNIARATGQTPKQVYEDTFKSLVSSGKAQKSENLEQKDSLIDKNTRIAPPTNNELVAAQEAMRTKPDGWKQMAKLKTRNIVQGWEEQIRGM